MVSVSLSKSELLGIRRLVVQNRDSARLQNISEIGYTESTNLLNKLRRK